MENNDLTEDFEKSSHEYKQMVKNISEITIGLDRLTDPKLSLEEREKIIQQQRGQNLCYLTNGNPQMVSAFHAYLQRKSYEIA